MYLRFFIEIDLHVISVEAIRAVTVDQCQISLYIPVHVFVFCHHHWMNKHIETLLPFYCYEACSQASAGAASLSFCAASASSSAALASASLPKLTTHSAILITLP